MSEKKLKEIRKANPKDAFLTYYELGADRSIERLLRELHENGIKICHRSLGNWCKRDKWVERVNQMDNEVAKAAEEIAIKNATRKKSQILNDTKAVMVEGIKAIKSGKIIPTPSDYKKMWEIMRTELGLNIDTEKPTTQNFIQVNQRIIKIVDSAENEIKEALLRENEATESPTSPAN